MNPIYTVVGKAHGSFEDEKTKKLVRYWQLFTTTPFDGEDKGDYHGEGLRTDKFSVTEPEVIKDVKVGQKVRIFFNQHKKVNYVAPVSAN